MTVFTEIHSQIDVDLLDRFKPAFLDDLTGANAVKDWVIEDVIAASEFTTISGLPSAGKSIITIDMAAHVAAGMPWNGKKVKQGLVIFFAGERREVTERRMIAFRQHHDVSAVPLMVLAGQVKLGDTPRDAEDIAEAARQYARALGVPCVWIIIDTLSRTFGNGDQNASKDMNRYVNECEYIRDRTGAAISVIHHTTWAGERGKGAVDLDGAVDASFLVKEVGGTRVLECDGSNDGEAGVVSCYELETKEIGVDANGKVTTAPIVKQLPIVKSRSAPTAGSSITKYKAVMDAIHDTVDTNNHVPLSLARERYYKDNPLPDEGDKAAADKRKTLFDNGVKAAVKASLITKDGTSITLLEDSIQDAE
ncbi:hypothetical protein A6U88_02405 [Agrobacterium sp. B131/95]|nr:hypothetical protein A6U88_02405 [Agrobacterium sp. B131/95]